MVANYVFALALHPYETYRVPRARNGEKIWSSDFYSLPYTRQDGPKEPFKEE